MRHFAIASINRATGEIEHIAVSNGPVVESMLPASGPSASRTVQRFEFESVDDTLIRGRDVLGALQMAGSTPAQRALPSAVIEKKQNSVVADNMINIVKK